MRLFFAMAALLALLALMGCAVPQGTGPVAPTPAPKTSGVPQADQAILRAKARNFVSVVKRVEPVAEAVCREQAPRRNCDFALVVDDRPGQPPNAFQTQDKSGRPIIGFTPALIVMAENADELAFVMSHEAAHHIRGHLAFQAINARVGAGVLAQIAKASGAGPKAVENASRLGAAVGARSYSKNYELEADSLGAIIAQRAGYDAMRGAQFFRRLPDPGDAFLGTHPPNAQRIEVVRRAVNGS